MHYNETNKTPFINLKISQWCAVGLLYLAESINQEHCTRSTKLIKKPRKINYMKLLTRAMAETCCLVKIGFKSLECLYDGMIVFLKGIP